MTAPRVVGPLVGADVTYPQSNLNNFGSDLGFSFEHSGRIYVLFGDTYPTRDASCHLGERDDDSMGFIPLEPGAAVPPIEFVTQREAANEFQRIRLRRNGELVTLDAFKVPVAGFSDGQQAYALFQSQTALRCDARMPCPAQTGVTCVSNVMTCAPAPVTVPVTCELAASTCFTGQCTDSVSLCVDTRSPQYDGSARGTMASVLSVVDIARSRPDDPATFDSIAVWNTNVFSHPTVRTVTKFSGKRDDNDYAPGTGSLLVWGRASMAAEEGRQARVYFATQRLPLEAAGFAPQYFAGIDPQTEEPRWTNDPAQAAPLALDGEPGGDPFEEVSIINTATVSWLGAPVNRWIMMYGGDMADFLLADPEGSRSNLAPGAIVMRFAEHPWGPWSAPSPYLAPGSPQRVGDPYGPGGLMFHPNCTDAGGATCARSDAYSLTLLGNCVMSEQAEQGRLYAPNIIDRYTRPNARGGLDFSWFVSTWNPYGVVMMQSSIEPPQAQPARGPEVANPEALHRLADWRSLPSLSAGTQYIQARGERGSHAFVCAGRDADLPAAPALPYAFAEPSCSETYVRGVALARFEGAGRMSRAWITREAITRARMSGSELLRVYVDDLTEPAIEVPLSAAMDGSAGEIFAAPFGSSSADRLAWYYPIVFQHKLIVALDGLAPNAAYYHEIDAVLDQASSAPPARERLAERDLALRQLRRLFRPAAGAQQPLAAALMFALAPGQAEALELEGPATIQELRARVANADFAGLADVRVRVYWDDQAQPAIDTGLLDLFGGSQPPEHSSLALTSVQAMEERVLALKLPMPFASRARWELENRGFRSARFELKWNGQPSLARTPLAYLHAQTRTTRSTLGEPRSHTVANATGHGRLVGTCLQVEAEPQRVLSGVLRAEVDGRAVLDGPRTGDYADLGPSLGASAFAGAFAQAWGMQRSLLSARASLCRWHVLGSELDFESGLDFKLELPGAGSVTSTAFLYLSP